MITQEQLTELGFDHLNRFDIDLMRLQAEKRSTGFGITLIVYGDIYENEGSGSQFLPQINSVDRLKELIKVLTVCEHKNEKMRQGDGFVYVTCKDCGKSL